MVNEFKPNEPQNLVEFKNSDKPPDISIIIPLLNEAASLEALYEKIIEIVAKTWTAEIIFVDDGSTDGSFEVLKKLYKRAMMLNPSVVVIQFRRNFGKAAALMAGFKAARGRNIITMDADLQDDPTEIPKLLAKLDEGYDVVSGWKRKRCDPLSKTLPSKIFNWVTAKITGIPIHDFNCGFKAYRWEVIRSLTIYGELHRYIPVLAYYKGYQVGEAEVQHHPRRYGKSKYGLARLLKGFFDFLTVLFLTGYANRPLHVFGSIGIPLTLVGLFICSYLTMLWFLGQGIGTRPLLTLGVLLIILGSQFISIGLLGEMITAMHSRWEDGYSIRQILHPTNPSEELIAGDNKLIQ